MDVDNEDDQESYFKARKDLPLIAYPDDEEEMEYDDDGNPIPPERSKVCTVFCFFLRKKHKGFIIDVLSFICHFLLL